MGRKKQLPEFVKGQVIALHRQGLSQREIANKVLAGKSAIGALIKRFEAEGNTSVRPRSGRPSLLKRGTILSMKRMIYQQPSISSTEISHQVSCMIGHVVHPSTVRKWCIQKLKLIARRPAKKPLLNVAQRKKRLDFAREHRNWTPEMWARVMFSDECMVSQFSSFRTFVRRPKGKRNLIRYSCPTVKQPQK